MARRSIRSGNISNKPKVVRTTSTETLNYHEGLSVNQVKIILREFNLDYNKFELWLYGQTCPIVQRYTGSGKLREVRGVYEYDLFRWIENQTKGTPLIWD